jgi:hypothetical protein
VTKDRLVIVCCINNSFSESPQDRDGRPIPHGQRRGSVAAARVGEPLVFVYYRDFPVTTVLAVISAVGSETIFVADTFIPLLRSLTVAPGLPFAVNVNPSGTLYSRCSPFSRVMIA